MGAMGRTSTLVLITTAAIDLDRVRSSSVVSGVEGRGTTSVYSGFLGMKIATFANARTTLEARKRYDWECLCESMMGYGLGGSLMPLSGRVGGGMYTKAADVGAFLVRKAERNILEDCQGTLCDNEEDTAGLIFLHLMLNPLVQHYLMPQYLPLVSINDMSAMLYPILMNSLGIIVCMVTTLLPAESSDVKIVPDVEPSLKWQLLISTVLLTLAIVVLLGTSLGCTLALLAGSLVSAGQIFDSISL
ncbi:hypothetical protein OPV22_029710 [Ensete ventricosum]|uniref:H(+)-exporting diphosphatase n=1 Tax=Ensete ventricosum TaxID=4639 RepID=A0AAV8QA06_ENSVE|nr:hypothetical protein OPV22_029710 [Ensete ventricosum]